MPRRETEPGLADAYSLRTPDDSRDLYRRWAETYESGFVEARGYVYHRAVARLFVEHGGEGPVLDAGCGTGVVGEALIGADISPVDGVDISPEMLAVAATKTTGDGTPVYRRLVEADLTQAVDLPDAAYAGVVSAGTFTHGHLGPDPLDELVRLADPGAHFAIGINAEHFTGLGFAAWLDQAEHSGRIAQPGLEEVAIYEGGDDEHASATALVALFTRADTP